jgi:hypothetical protein
MARRKKPTVWHKKQQKFIGSAALRRGAAKVSGPQPAVEPDPLAPVAERRRALVQKLRADIHRAVAEKQ